MNDQSDAVKQAALSLGRAALVAYGAGFLAKYGMTPTSALDIISMLTGPLGALWGVVHKFQVAKEINSATSTGEK